MQLYGNSKPEWTIYCYFSTIIKKTMEAENQEKESHNTMFIQCNYSLASNVETFVVFMTLVAEL